MKANFLRAAANRIRERDADAASYLDEAADALTALERDNERYRKALEEAFGTLVMVAEEAELTFAEAAKVIGTASRARQALEGTTPQETGK